MTSNGCAMDAAAYRSTSESSGPSMVTSDPAAAAATTDHCSWLNEPDKYPVIYEWLIEQSRPFKKPVPLAAVTKLLWNCWQTEDWFPTHD